MDMHTPQGSKTWRYRNVIATFIVIYQIIQDKIIESFIIFHLRRVHCRVDCIEELMDKVSIGQLGAVLLVPVGPEGDPIVAVSIEQTEKRMLRIEHYGRAHLFRP